MQQRTLIIGSGGRLGTDLISSFQGDHIIGLKRSDLNLTDPTAINALVRSLDFDRLILTASITNVDYCEDHREEAFQVNAEAPKLLAEIAAEKNAHVTYVSTDFVFDGSACEPLTENELPNPLSAYGASKLEGERAVLTSSPDNLVARVSWLFGPSRPAFPEWILSKAETETQLSLPADKTACPTSSTDVAHFLKALLDQNETPASGLYHVCNSGHCTWQEWGQACLDQAKEHNSSLQTQTIEPNALESIVAFKAERPKFSALDNSKLSQFLGSSPRPWRDALHEHITNTYNNSPTTQQSVA